MKRFALPLLIMACVVDAQAKGFFAEAMDWNDNGAFNAVAGTWDPAGGVSGGVVLSEEKFSGGKEIRVGYLRPVGQGFDLGGSVGYVRGPRATFTSSLRLPSPSNFTSFTKVTYKGEFTRALLEARQRWSMADKREFRLRAGLGYAIGKIKYAAWNLTDGGLGASVTTQEVIGNYGGFTWELGPSVAFLGDRVNVDVGLVYADFPDYNKPNIRNGEVWTPFGLRLGIEF